MKMCSTRPSVPAATRRRAISLANLTDQLDAVGLVALACAEEQIRGSHAGLEGAESFSIARQLGSYVGKYAIALGNGFDSALCRVLRVVHQAHAVGDCQRDVRLGLPRLRDDIPFSRAA
jgi:hypothetical protein